MTAILARLGPATLNPLRARPGTENPVGRALGSGLQFHPIGGTAAVSHGRVRDRVQKSETGARFQVWRGAAKRFQISLCISRLITFYPVGDIFGDAQFDPEKLMIACTAGMPVR